MDDHHPRLIIVNFPETDTKGHTGDMPSYLAAIKNVDSLINALWTKIQTDDFYKDNTTLFITNDHGRHADTVSSGFSGHGDHCDGCEHIMCLALGRHVSPNQEIGATTYQTDIAPTVGTLLGFSTPYADGQNLYGIDPPLPVEVLSFSASVTGAGIKLNWRTETEINNYGFDIERTPLSPLFIKGGKKEEWEKIGFVEGYGNSNSVKEYSFVDEDIIYESYFYRLKQIDNDGTYEYSNVIEIAVDGVPGMFALEQNYPNPFNPVTTIDYSLPVKSQVRLIVYNVLGENLFQLVNEVKEAGSYSVELNAAGLPGGVYFYALQTEVYVETRKMVILK